MFRYLIFDPCYAYFLQIPRIGIIFTNYLIRDNAKNARVIDAYVISLLLPKLSISIFKQYLEINRESKLQIKNWIFLPLIPLAK